MRKKLLFSILSVVAISVLTFGVTYAYYVSSSNAGLTGDGYEGINTVLSLEKIYHASKLVPLDDSLIETAVSKTNNKCIDNSGYEVCSLYKITLDNTENIEELYGYVKTESSTYTTDNLKYKFFDSNYNDLTDVMTLSKNENEIVYFENNENYFKLSVTGSMTYYLAIWLTDTGEEQSEDYSKKFNGYIGFESGTEDGRIEAEFNS